MNESPTYYFCDLFLEYLVIHGPSVNEQHSGEAVWYWNTFSKFSNPSPLVKIWKAFSLKIMCLKQKSDLVHFNVKILIHWEVRMHMMYFYS